MSTTMRVGSALLPGYFHVGDRGLGVLASTIPATGAHGPAIPYPGLSLPADAGAEVLTEILSVPGTLTFFSVDELGRVVAEGPAGSHVGTYRLWLDGVDRGSSTYTVQIGGGELAGTFQADDVGVGGGLGANSGTITGGATLGDVAAGGGAGSAPSGISGGATLDDAQAGGGGSAPSGTISGDAAVGDVQAGGGASSLPSGSAGGNAQLDDVQVAGGGNLQPSAINGGATLDDAQAGGGATSLPSGTAGGDARLDDGALGGGMGSQQPTILGGDLQGGEGVLGGGVQGYQEPVAVIGYRYVDVSIGTTPKHLAPLDVAEVDDIAFKFAGRLNEGETVATYVASCTVRVGVDAQPTPLLQGQAQKFGTVAVVRVSGAAGVVGATYLLRVVATLTNGRTITGAAFIKIVRRS